jgi:hypothetical protein
MFLGVMYISEISNITGGTLQQGILTGTHDTTIYTITLTKPTQTCPNKQSWELWSTVITEFTVDGKELEQKLGKWTSDHSKSGHWSSYIYHNKVHRHIPQGTGTQTSWERYSTHGTQLRLEEAIDFTKFSPTNPRCIPFPCNYLTTGNNIAPFTLHYNSYYLQHQYKHLDLW